jgi:hypothetical protein
MDATDAQFSKSEKLEIWREAVTHLRGLNDEAWKRFQFFLWLELLAFVGAVAVARTSRDLFVFLFLFGFFILFVARYILKRNRIYYLQMLLKKTLLEDDLGFYREKFPGSESDLAFPWRVAPEVIVEMKKDPEAWIQKSIRGKGTIARWQFVIYEVWIALHSVILLTAAVKFVLAKLR